MSKQTENYGKIAQAVGLRYDAVNDLLYGQKADYEFILTASDNRYPYMFMIQTTAVNAAGTTLSKEEKKEIVKSSDKITNVKQEGNQLFFFQKNVTNQEKLIQAVTDSLNNIVSFLRAKGYHPCCSLCGQSVETAPFRVGMAYQHLCPECELRLRDSNTLAAQAKAQKKENVVGGIVGALLGALLGVICIVLLSRMGYVAALSGVAMAVGVLKGYELLSGKLTGRGIIISVIVMLLMTYVGDRLDWAILLAQESGENLLFCYRLIPELIAEDYIEMGSYLANLILLYLFLLLGAVPTIRSSVKNLQMENRIARIGSVSMSDFGQNVENM